MCSIVLHFLSQSIPLVAMLTEIVVSMMFSSKEYEGRVQLPRVWVFFCGSKMQQTLLKMEPTNVPVEQHPKPFKNEYLRTHVALIMDN